MLAVAASLLLAAPAPAAEIDWNPQFQWALEQAKSENKIVMVDFFTHWCHWCKVLDQKTYVDPTVCDLANRLVSVKVNAESEVAVAARYGVSAYPTITFLNPDGSLRKQVRGFLPPDQFAATMREVLDVSGEIDDFSRRVWKKPDDDVSRVVLSNLLATAGRYGESLAQIDTLLLLPNVSTDAREGYALDRGILLLKAGRAEEARDRLEEWLDGSKKSPRRAEALFYLAQAHDAVGKKKDAKKSYQKAQKEGPGSWFSAEAKRRLTAD